MISYVIIGTTNSISAIKKTLKLIDYLVFIKPLLIIIIPSFLYYFQYLNTTIYYTLPLPKMP